MKHIGIYPSIMCSKPWDLKDYIKEFEETKIDAIHFDVMDGHFVPNIMLGSAYFNAIREITTLPIDVHLMCEQPEVFIPYFKLQENDMCSFHPETTRHPYRLLQQIRSMNVKAGLAISPATTIDYIENCLNVLDFVLVMAVNPGFAGQKMVPDHIEKLKKIKALVDKADHKIELIIDGNTTAENTKLMIAAGADGVVAGTSNMLKYGPEKYRECHDAYLNEIQK